MVPWRGLALREPGLGFSGWGGDYLSVSSLLPVPPGHVGPFLHFYSLLLPLCLQPIPGAPADSALCLLGQAHRVWQLPGPRTLSPLLPRLPPDAPSYPWAATANPALLGPSQEFNFTKCRKRPFIKWMLFSQVKPNVSGWREILPLPSLCCQQFAWVSKPGNMRVLSRSALSQCLRGSGCARPGGCQQHLTTQTCAVCNGGHGSWVAISIESN